MIPVRVAGFRHAPSHWPWNLLWLGERVFAADVEPVREVGLWDVEPQGEPDRCEVRLIREPDNPADPNAVRVEVPALVEGGFHPWVGYVCATDARWIAERMDRGMRPVAWVARIPVKSPEDLGSPGLRLYVDWLDGTTTP